MQVIKNKFYWLYLIATLITFKILFSRMIRHVFDEVKFI